MTKEEKLTKTIENTLNNSNHTNLTKNGAMKLARDIYESIEKMEKDSAEPITNS
ncbi:MAG: hypothetical protein SFU99_03985 [Saprospiraceae bacterium]|nr:hypothetical protein [Saprospiraceae bacterium]